MATVVDKRQAAYLLPSELIEEIKTESRTLRIYPANFVEKACREYLARQEAKPKSRPDRRIAS